jgi:hypothetical protein
MKNSLNQDFIKSLVVIAAGISKNSDPYELVNGAFEYIKKNWEKYEEHPNLTAIAVLKMKGLFPTIGCLLSELVGDEHNAAYQRGGPKHHRNVHRLDDGIPKHELQLLRPGLMALALKEALPKVMIHKGDLLSRVHSKAAPRARGRG